MFARTVCLQLKPNSVAAFTQIIAKDIIPLLRQQPGCQDEMAVVVPDGTAAVGIRLWNCQEQAAAYDRGIYPAVRRALANVVESTPQVHTYEVSNSTFHKIVPRVAA
jgi:hypothetical protein